MESKVAEILNRVNPEIGDNIDIDVDIIEKGYIDSLEIVNIVMDLEDEFDIEIDPELVIPENFSTIRTIVEMLSGIIGK